ncbi:putative ABC transporter ATP-binding protein YxlF [Paenibacillus plantiphilus]|uniref:ABC transporter ATP-binding protein YxlF n=1 Tax=Paenibacillus plantiphilus TaxID=2905650 RepID=A0ABM9CIQ5_9BACL|nr:ATP-binding cassette domain-containing protein [Paenibacillus plantiphilus]CAH1215313.1 putative ABC transporter ATP-binding protein YxlF [Paenibacillus plantiphilus]
MKDERIHTVHIQDLAKSYRRKHALQPLQLKLMKGVTGLLGPNGAGKTTFMSLLATLVKPSNGTAQIYGHDLIDGARDIRSLLGYMPQRVNVPGQLTGEELLLYAASMKGIKDAAARKQEAERVLNEVNLLERSGDRLKGYSGGMRQRIGIAQALIGQPRLLLFDEPTAGLDPSERIRFRNLVRGLGQERTVLLSTHIVSDLDSTCEYVVVFHKGRLHFQGTLQELADQAAGKVWETIVSPLQAEEWYAKRLVVSGSREGDGMRLRLIADEIPTAEAKSVEPTLEDGYVAVLKENML